jgi:hypothetical protein
MGELKEIDPWTMVLKAASFLVRNGPVTQQDRWEEEPGYSPFTLAVEVSALINAADFAEDAGYADVTRFLKKTADIWNEGIERLLHRLGFDELPVNGVYETVDVWVVRGGDTVTVLLTNHARTRHPIETEPVHVQLTGLLSPRNVYIERIDDNHANAKRLWIEMGSPALPTKREIEQLHAASQIVREPLHWRYEAEILHMELAIPSHAIAAITVELAPKRLSGDPPT